MTQKRNLAAVCILVLLLELTSLVPGQECSSTYQPIPGQPGRDGRDGNDGSAGSNGNHGTPGRDGRDGSPAVFTHEDFLKLKEMLIDEGVYFSQNSATPSPSTTVTPNVTTTQAIHSTATCPTPPPEVQRDCQQFHSNGFNQSGVYTIRPDSLLPFDVYCDMDTDGGGWTVWQRRQDGSVDFYRNWDNYTTGFGNLCGEFWLGLDKINRLTNASSSELRVDLGDCASYTAYAKYSTFQVDDASTNYTLTVSGYSGTAGDSLSGQSHGSQFTTYDQSNDGWSTNPNFNCAVHSRGAWWYKHCTDSNLNGQYIGDGPVQSGTHTSVFWWAWRRRIPLTFTEMKVRRSN